MITITFPTDEEGERSRRFAVHRNYLGSIDLMAGVLYGHGEDQARRLVAAQRARPAFGRIQRRPFADVAELRRLLAISWASETQLRLAGVGGDVFLRYSNAWAPVQAYYAVYMSLHAWFVTAGMGGLIEDHTRSLRSAVSHLVERGLLPHPFDLTCTGCPELGERQISGAPANAPLNAHFENLATPSIADFYPRIAKMLETTRDLRLERLNREWKKSRGRMRMRMLAAQKRDVAANLHPTSLLDYLWRLRIRSNYGDVSAFLMGGVDDRSHAMFWEGLVTLASSLCLLTQSLIVARVGPAVYAAAIDEFTGGGGIDLGEPVRFLRERREVLVPAIPARRVREPFAPMT